jgi:26S proteasome regulatory subunit N13
MATNALITFKAGKCDLRGKKVTPDATPGYLFLYVEDDIPHFCWRPRSAPPTEPEIDLFMVPGDGTFQPLLKEEGAEELHSPTNGRIYVLKFSSSSQRHFFWMQSKTQHKDGTLSWFSQRDQRVGQIVNDILQGEEDVDIDQAVQELRHGGGDGDGDGDDDLMDLDEQPESRNRHGSTGGAGADATGADPRDEGEASREGGADGGRA